MLEIQLKLVSTMFMIQQRSETLHSQGLLMLTDLKDKLSTVTNEDINLCRCLVEAKSLPIVDPLSKISQLQKSFILR